MSDIVIGGWSDIWRTDLGYASVRSPDIRQPPQTISYTYHMLITGNKKYVGYLEEILGTFCKTKIAIFVKARG